MLPNILLQVNTQIFLKDPESSELGRRILSGSIDLLESIGFEAFTFKKLSDYIDSTEASVYRYFESKHKLLLYLTDWYWAWLEYHMAFSLANITSAHERLERAVELLTSVVAEDGKFPHINEMKLQNIVIAESSKVYLNREVDIDNKTGAFSRYKHIVKNVGDIILEINASYKYPHMLVSTVIEGAHYQRFFAVHLPRLTDIVVGEDAVTSFYKEMVLKAIINTK
jgi:AcrR family transcriptional regulator